MGVGETIVTVSVVLIVLVMIDVAAGGTTVVVSGRPVMIVVVVLLTETMMSHSTPVTFLYLRSEGVPSSLIEKPLVTSRLPIRGINKSRPSISRRLIRGTGVASIRRGKNPGDVGTVVVGGIDVVVVVKVVVVVTTFVKVVATAVSVTVSCVV